MRALPDKQRQQSSLPLIHQLRQPMPSHAGASVSAQRFRADVRTHRIGPGGDIPQLSQDFVRKVLADLRHLAMI